MFISRKNIPTQSLLAGAVREIYELKAALEMGMIAEQLKKKYRVPRGKPQRRSVGLWRQVPRADELIAGGKDPLHVQYVIVQHLSSIFAEKFSARRELSEYEATYEAMEEEYMPQGPPMSPLTGSYFTLWAFFDLLFGPDRETIGSLMLELASQIQLKGGARQAVENCVKSRMGIYIIRRAIGKLTTLEELGTGQTISTHIASRYRGKVGELLFIRVLPPLEGFDYYLGMTTPYVLRGFTADEWLACIERNLPQETEADFPARLHQYLKYGPDRRYWPEFIFQAYAGHQLEAIFLTGLPDVAESRPHSS